MTGDPAAIARAGLLELGRQAGSTTWVDAHGSSMSPSIPAGSRLLVELGRQPVGIGEVILFRGHDGLIAHRLVARRIVAGESRLIAKGDGEALADRPIGAVDVIGVVVDVEQPPGHAAQPTLGGRGGTWLARTSWWGDRWGRSGRRITRRLPLPTSQAATRGVLALSRVPTRVLVASILRLDRRNIAERR
jgi:hypothetical protein